jgi:ATP-binding cassette subfamily A (ABC1) protein 3
MPSACLGSTRSGGHFNAHSAHGAVQTYPPNKDGVAVEAVRDLWLGVPRNQVFGFLGTNGAGKTTTLSVLSGEISATAGRALVGGYNAVDFPSLVRRLLAYCPQFNPLFPLLTGREHLLFYARLRGMAEADAAALADQFIEELGVVCSLQARGPACVAANAHPCADGGGRAADANAEWRHAAQVLSGHRADWPARDRAAGRALHRARPALEAVRAATARHCTCAPCGLCANEGGRLWGRRMWNYLASKVSGKAVVLTTHSMEECEALAGRVGIMANGELRCLGTLAHLKSRYGRGLVVSLTMDSLRHALDAHAFMRQTFADDGVERLKSSAGGLTMQYRLTRCVCTRLMAQESPASTWTARTQAGQIAADSVPSAGRAASAGGARRLRRLAGAPRVRDWACMPCPLHL